MIPKFDQALENDPSNTMGRALRCQLRQIELTNSLMGAFSGSGYFSFSLDFTSLILGLLGQER